MRSSYGIVRRETSTLSSDGYSWLRVLVWFPDSTYTRRGVVQLVHGMSEHIGRYDQFARFLASFGYVVIGHDHIGHGKSVSSSRELGCMSLEDGKEVLIQDVLHVRKVVLTDGETGIKRADANLPYFLFGHSMGSYIVRVIAARKFDDLSTLAGVVLCGTGNQPHLLAVAGNLICRAIGAIKGQDHRSALLYSLVSGSFASAIDNPRTEFDWLSTDPRVVDVYCSDPLSGTRFSAGAYAALTGMVAEAVSKTSAASVPCDLPMLFISGEEDPVGSMGKGVHKAVSMYQRQGVKDIKEILYPDMRHEILNEPDKMRVFSDVESWLTQHAILHSIQQEKTQQDTEEQKKSASMTEQE